MTVNKRIGSRKMANSYSHVLKIAGKKTAYNEAACNSISNMIETDWLTEDGKRLFEFKSKNSHNPKWS